MPISRTFAAGSGPEVDQIGNSSMRHFRRRSFSAEVFLRGRAAGTGLRAMLGKTADPVQERRLGRGWGAFSEVSLDRVRPSLEKHQYKLRRLIEKILAGS